MSDRAFRGEGVAFGDAMTLAGTVNKTGILLVCAFVSAAWTWNLTTQSPEQAAGLMILGSASSAPRYMEWYAGFALLITLVWLYLEILRLLAKMRDRD